MNTKVKLPASQSPASFEVVMCTRDLDGNKLPQKKRIYRGTNPKAVEATFLSHLHDEEKKTDVYAF